VRSVCPTSAASSAVFRCVNAKPLPAKRPSELLGASSAAPDQPQTARCN
jgi:hypothetical protein